MNDEQAYTVVGGRGSMTVFEIYIKTTPERLWEAITSEQMRKRYSFGVGTVSDWTPGSEYKAAVPGVIEIAGGENLEVEPPRRLVQSFTALWSEDVQRGQQRALRRLADDPLRPEDAAGDRRGPRHARLVALLRRRRLRARS